MSSDSDVEFVPEMDTAPIIGVGLVLAAAIGFSAKAIFIKLAYRHGVGAVALLALRMAMSVPFFLAMAWWSGRAERIPMSRRDTFAVVALGLIGFYLASLLDFLGLQLIDAGLERLILFLYPTLVVVISALLFRRPVGRREALALALSYGGIALVFVREVSGGGNGVAQGAALVFGSAVAYAVYLIGGGEVMRRVGALRFTAYAMSVSSIAALLQFFATEPLSALSQPAPVYQLTLAMAVFSTVVPALMLSAGIQRVGARTAALVGASGPVSTLFLASVVLGEALAPSQLLGAVLVMAGVLTVSIKRRG